MEGVVTEGGGATAAAVPAGVGEVVDCTVGGVAIGTGEGTGGGPEEGSILTGASETFGEVIEYQVVQKGCRMNQRHTSNRRSANFEIECLLSIVRYQFQKFSNR